jgi:hypothetical protein
MRREGWLVAVAKEVDIGSAVYGRKRADFVDMDQVRQGVLNKNCRSA